MLLNEIKCPQHHKSLSKGQFNLCFIHIYALDNYMLSFVLQGSEKVVYSLV